MKHTDHHIAVYEMRDENKDELSRRVHIGLSIHCPVFGPFWEKHAAGERIHRFLRARIEHNVPLRELQLTLLPRLATRAGAVVAHRETNHCLTSFNAQSCQMEVSLFGRTPMRLVWSKPHGDALLLGFKLPMHVNPYGRRLQENRRSGSGHQRIGTARSAVPVPVAPAPVEDDDFAEIGVGMDLIREPLKRVLDRGYRLVLRMKDGQPALLVTRVKVEKVL